MSMLQLPEGVAISGEREREREREKEKERKRERERDHNGENLSCFFYPFMNRQFFGCHSIPWIACSLWQSEDEVEAGYVCPAPAWFCLKKPHLHTDKMINYLTNADGSGRNWRSSETASCATWMLASRWPSKRKDCKKAIRSMSKWASQSLKSPTAQKHFAKCFMCFKVQSAAHFLFFWCVLCNAVHWAI